MNARVRWKSLTVERQFKKKTKHQIKHINTSRRIRTRHLSNVKWTGVYLFLLPGCYFV